MRHEIASQFLGSVVHAMVHDVPRSGAMRILCAGDEDAVRHKDHLTVLFLFSIMQCVSCLKEFCHGRFAYKI